MRNIIAGVMMSVVAVACAADFDVKYSGQYVWGHEVNSFQSCDSDAVYWVSASTWVSGPLLDYYRSLAEEPYQPIYIEFRGHLLDEELDGFAADYDGLIRISEVLSKSKEIPTTCR